MRVLKRKFVYNPISVREEITTILQFLPGWRIKKPTDEFAGTYCGEIINDEKPGYRIWIGLRDAPKKYSAENYWPDWPNNINVNVRSVNVRKEHLIIGTDFQRGPEAFAAAIKKRLIPYIDENLPEVLQQYEKLKSELDAKNATIFDLSYLFGNKGLLPEHTVSGKWGINEIQVNDSGTSGVVQMSYSSFPIEFIKKLIYFMKENYPQ